jgi:hypothetical protein
MGIKIYTSYYKKMKDYPKGENDCFIQVSRTCPFWFVKDGKSLIDINAGEMLGNFSDNLDEYRGQLEAIHDDLAQMADEWKAAIQENEAQLEPEEGRLFLLCYENIEKKPCHRRIIAGYFEEQFGFVIPEWRDT